MNQKNNQEIMALRISYEKYDDNSIKTIAHRNNTTRITYGKQYFNKAEEKANIISPNQHEFTRKLFYACACAVWIKK